MKKIITLSFLIIGCLASCTEDINLNIIGKDATIVVEGSIENGDYAFVILTHSSSVSKPFDFNNLLITDAQVYVSNGAITDTLQFVIDSTASLPFGYRGSKLLGVVGETYFLTIIADGKKYTATTTIPTPVAMDSVWWKAQPPNDTVGFAWAHLTDPPGFGNAYRWQAKRASKDRRYIAPNGATFDDKFIDGKSFDTYYNVGQDPTAAPDTASGQNNNNPFDNMFTNKDTIYTKFCTIDYTTFRFYITYETAAQNNTNPFASPTSVSTNIQGGGLGVWAGFGATYDTIMPKP
jgi:Domain of unknown function (DUF4249)